MIRSSRARKLLAGASAAALGLLTPALAHADPITAVIVSAVNIIAGAGVAAAVGNFLIAYGAIVYTTAASWALSKVSASKASAARDRQASVQQLSVGEVPREAIVGEAGTGGSLVDVYWFGGTDNTDWNVLVIAVADHRCHSLVGFYVLDTYVAFTGDGEVPGYNGQLRVYWRAGTATDAPLPSDIAGLGPATANGALKGVARVIVAYKADAPDSKNPIWTSGRPSFVWVVKGLLCYDPRKDSTVPGGSGSHRWNDPSTREWTDNAEICRYNISRGVYFLDQVDDPSALMLGRGLSEYEAPPSRAFAPANLCDELVSWTDTTTGTTYTEPRYRVGGVISADQSFDTVEQWFADAMAGHVIQPEGGVAVEPGQAKSPVAAITDDDLLVGGSVQWSDEVSDADRINSVVVSYVEPVQKFAMTTAGVLRDDGDIVNDGGPKETQLPLNLVRHRSQALRIGEIKRRGARMERRGVLPLPPKFAGLEEGDWITYTSSYRTKGQPITMRVTKFALNEAWQNTVALEETAYAVYGFGALGVFPPTDPTILPVSAVALTGVLIAPIVLTGSDGSETPAIKATWSTPVDAALVGIRAEVRVYGSTDVSPTRTEEVNAGSMVITNGVPSSGNLQVRLVPIAGPGRGAAVGPWVDVVVDALLLATMGTEDGLLTVYYQPGPPASPERGDVWFDTDAGNAPFQWDGALWISAANNAAVQAIQFATAAQSTANSKVKVYYQTSAPTAETTGDLWVDTDDPSRRVFRWSGSAWQQIADQTGFNIAAGISGQGSLATQNWVVWATQVTGVGRPEDYANRVLVYRQMSAPSSPGTNDIWVQLNGSGVAIAMWVWNGSVWINGADRTIYNIAAGISGQGTLATQNQVTTTLIAANAVSKVAYGEASGRMSFGTSPTLHFSMSYTSSGGAHIVHVVGEAGVDTYDPVAGASVILYCNGVPLKGASMLVPAGWGQDSRSFLATHTPGAGACYYTVTYQASPGSGAIHANNTSVMVLELQR